MNIMFNIKLSTFVLPLLNVGPAKPDSLQNESEGTGLLLMTSHLRIPLMLHFMPCKALISLMMSKTVY
jgi:hypothetical protein